MSEIGLCFFQPKSKLRGPEGELKPIGISVHSMAEFRAMLEDYGVELRPDPEGRDNSFNGLPIYVEPGVTPGYFRFRYPIPFQEPSQ